MTDNTVVEQPKQAIEEPVTTTPAAQPAAEAPAEPAPQPTPEPAPAPTEPPAEYPVYNDEAADSIVAVLKESNVTPDAAGKLFKAFAETGNPDDIDRAALIAAVGKEKAHLVMIGVKDFVARSSQAARETKEVVTSTLGGEANLAKVQAWVQANRSNPEFAAKITEIQKLIDTNKTAAALAAKELRAMFEADPTNQSLGTKIVQGDTAASAQQQPQLTRAEYLKKMAQASRSPNRAAEHAALRAAYSATLRK